MHQAIKQLCNYIALMKMSGIDFIEIPNEAQDRAAHEVDTPTTERLGPKEELLSLRESVVRCTKCEELAMTRKTVVFGSGHARAKLVFVGEAPGQEEDLQGLPFVGKAGQLLTKIIESIGLKREHVFICNVLKCRPPGNRNPSPNEISNCEPYLFKQLEIIGPKIICALGTFAAQALLKTDASISSLRGRFYDYRGVKLMCTFHPAYLLRNPDDKRKVWEDMKMIHAELAKDI
ncbi:MAG: uracil-DNA glycosylase [Candidatus Omnitrophica bacterium]|nr:uracil-DNA glycosylase [Candidatus Omnitrophota bacterium]